MSDGPFDVSHDPQQECYFVRENGKPMHYYHYADSGEESKAKFDAHELATMLNVAYLTGYLDAQQKRGKQ